LISALAAVACLLLLAPAALAEDGVGLAGRTTDKMVTYWGLALVVFFPVLIAVLSYVQGRLERAKAERKRGLARFSQQ
jgi:hypothetical protein